MTISRRERVFAYLGWVAIIAAVVLYGHNARADAAAAALPTGLCSADQALVAAPDHTWFCAAWPLTTPQPTTTATPTPAPSSAGPTTPVPTTSTPTSTTPAPTTTTPPPPATTPALNTIKAYITGYSWYDNDPPGSAAIAYPSQGRSEAGGQGTFSNPITVAVRKGTWPAGTKFYLPEIRKYIVVEDQCVGCSPIPAPATSWLDVWVDGRAVSNSTADQCMGKITRVAVAVVNPPSTLKVESTAPVSSNGCPTYGDSIVYAS